GRAVARLAVEDDVLGAVGRGALDARLQIGLGHVLGSGDVARAPLLGLTHVDDQRAVGGLLTNDGGIDLIDPALDLAEDFGSGRTHRVKLLKGDMDSNTSRSIAPRESPVRAFGPGF